MTDEPKRRSYAVDDVETINRRMKEIAAEREAKIAETELPCDIEPIGFGLIPLAREMSLAEMFANGELESYIPSLDCDCAACKEHYKTSTPSIYSDAYWQPLIDSGVLSMVEPGDA